MAINGVGIAQRKAFVLILTAPPTSKGHKSGIATYPLLATRRLHQRHRGIATKAAMVTGNGLGFHPIVCHHVSLSRGTHPALPTALAWQVHHAEDRSILLGHVDLTQ